MWDEITYPFLNFNGATVEITYQFHLTLYQACDYLSMLGLKLNHVSKRGPWSFKHKIPSSQYRDYNFEDKTIYGPIYWYDHNNVGIFLVGIFWPRCKYKDCAYQYIWTAIAKAIQFYHRYRDASLYNSSKGILPVEINKWVVWLPYLCNGNY